VSFFGNLFLAIQNGGKSENPNIETRNPKQYQNPNFQNPIYCQAEVDSLSFWSFVFPYLSLFRVSIFEFRISVSLGIGSDRDLKSSILNRHFREQDFSETVLGARKPAVETLQERDFQACQ